jgi:hypothetical protein
MKELSLPQWAQEEFGHAKLGNALRVQRLVLLAAGVARRPAGTVTKVVSSAAEQEGAFRWLESSHVSAEDVAKASHIATVRRCSSEKFVFVPVDQTSITITDLECQKGLGPAGDRKSRRKRGLQIMSALAVDKQGTTIGLCAQSWWARSDTHSPPSKKDTRPPEERESYHWVRVMRAVREQFDANASESRPWFQLDRGGDFWAPLHEAHEKGEWMTVRAAYDRRLETSYPIKHLRPKLQAQRPLGHYRVEIPARPGRPTRTATLQVRVAKVTLRLTARGQRCMRVPVTAVYVKESNRVPRGQEPLDWMLLTTYPVETFQDACLVIYGYAQRWRIEDFHRTWKSGTCDIESSQLRSSDALQKWGIVLAAVAARTERLKHLARQSPNVPAMGELTRAEIDAAIILSKTRKYRIGDVLTIAQAVTLIAEVGGYTGKSSGGPPGAIVISRGLREVMSAALVVEHMQGEKR